jgi:hypothetical protein
LGEYLSIFGSVDASDADDRALGAILQIVAWTMVSVSVLPEMWIDLSGKQQQSLVSSRSGSGAAYLHGRYGSRRSAILSWGQTITFLSGAVCMGISMKRQWDDDITFASDFFRFKDDQLSWETMFLISGVLMTMSGLLAVVLAGCCCCGGGADRNEEYGAQKKTSRVLVQTSNIMFLCAAGAQVFAVAVDGFCGQCFLGFFVLVGSYAAWCGCGVLWIVADAILPRDGAKPEGDNEQQNDGVVSIEIEGDQQQAVHY